MGETRHWYPNTEQEFRNNSPVLGPYLICRVWGNNAQVKFQVRFTK